MNLIGAHVVVFSKNPKADRTFLKKISNLPHVDAGEGWLIFALPPSEVAFHPSNKNNLHQLYFMCDNIDEFISEMKTARVQYSPVKNLHWGLLTNVKLPGGGIIGVYEPSHKRPLVYKTPNRSSKKRRNRSP